MATTIQPHNQPIQLTLFDLDALEQKIRAGLQTFYEVGDAIRKIRDAEGYKLRGYLTLESYLEKEFGFGLRHGERMIAAAGAVDKVKQLTDGKMPRNEAVSRELNRVIARDDAAKVMKKVESELAKRKTDVAQATAAQVKEAVDKALGVKPAEKGTKPAPVDDLTTSAPSLDTITDFCPNCGSVPETYIRQADGWHCSECDGIVMLGVIARS